MRRLFSLFVFLLLFVIALLDVGCGKPRTAPPVKVPFAALAPDPPPPAVPRKRVLDVPLWTQTIAVLDVKVRRTAPDTVTEDLVHPLTERIESAFLSTGRFDLVERARLEAVKSELAATSDSLWFDQTSVAKMGKFLGAHYIILPSARMEVGVFTTRLDLMVKVLDTATGSIVQTFDVKTASASMSVNSSVTACLDRIRLELAEALHPVYPAQAVIVRSPRPGVFWCEAKQVQMFKAGQRVRVLRNEDVFNPIKGTNAPFTVEVGRGRIQSVESQGLVVIAQGIAGEDGWLVEVLQ